MESQHPQPMFIGVEKRFELTKKISDFIGFLVRSIFCFSIAYISISQRHNLLDRPIISEAIDNVAVIVSAIAFAVIGGILFLLAADIANSVLSKFLAQVLSSNKRMVMSGYWRSVFSAIFVVLIMSITFGGALSVYSFLSRALS